MDTISVALAVYNGEEFLQAQLDSIKNQLVQPDELIIVDDNSTDNSAFVYNNFNTTVVKKIYINDQNIGVIKSFKKAVSLCSGDYIALCDQDDIWLSEKLQESIARIKKIDKEIPAVIFSDLSVMDKKGNILHNSFWKIRSAIPSNFTLEDILYGNIITGCTAVINRAMAAEFNKMPDEIMMHDHWLALIAYSFGKFDYIHKPMVLYRAHGESVTDKGKASYIQNFIKEYTHRQSYLAQNIEQAKAFKQLYQNNLSEQDAAIIQRFIDLEHKNFLQKRLARDSRSLYRRLKKSGNI